jgi:hypothetical protein
MPLPVVPATIKVSMFYTLNGEPAMNRMHVGVAATLPSAGDCAVAAAIFGNWWISTASLNVSSAMALNLVEAISIAEVNGPQATFTAGLPAAGALASPSLPGNNAFCVSLRSLFTGRSARGRWYWGGLTESQVTGNTVGTSDVTAIVGAMNSLLGLISAASAFPVIVSYNSGGGPRPGGPVKFFIDHAIAVDQTVDSQRGRLH